MEKIILLINRDQAFLDHTSSILQDAGYSIHTASDLGGALSTLSNHLVGLVICDNKLKDISGLDLIRYLKKDPLRENIPFMFLVSTRQQGDAFKAFELNAIDYLVYPLEDEILIDRVDEVFSGSGLKPAPPEKPSKIADKNNDKTTGDDPIILSKLSIDVSRDNAIWLPGKITRFYKEGLSIETALFGKPEMFLMARIKLDNETVVLNGHIKEISYEDFQKPACIEMTIETGEAWDRIHTYLRSQTTPAKEDADEPEVEEEFIDLGDVFLPPSDEPEKNFIQTGTFQPKEISKPSYDQRFYYSIIGKQLDSYRAITLINTSSMGGLMQGWDVDREREVALKVISYHLSGQQQFYEAFFKEAHSVSRLSHPNIAQIFYFGSSNDILYYATEFIDGLTIEDLIDRQGNLNNIKGLEYMIAVCEALYHAHQNSVCHRNIKPNNIMVDNSGTVRIIDFGLGFCEDCLKAVDKKAVISHSMYMPPEQVAGRAMDNRSDIYSVGAAFYHAFTGSPPFEAKNLEAFITAPMKTPLPPMKKKNPDIPATLAQIIEKMMAKAPLNRYQNFKSALKDIKSLHMRVANRKRTAP